MAAKLSKSLQGIRFNGEGHSMEVALPTGGPHINMVLQHTYIHELVDKIHDVATKGCYAVVHSETNT